MTATIRTVLDLPGTQPKHIATVTLPPAQPLRWKRTFKALRQDEVATAPHSIGVHVYSQRHEDGGYGLAVRWNAGLVRKNQTGFAGRIYFDSLSIQVGGDENLVLVPELRAKMRYDSATATHYICEGGGHEFQPRGILERRFCLVPKTWNNAQVEAFKNKVFRFQGTRFPQDIQWGPARERQPKVNRGHYSTLFGNGASQARHLLATGQPGSVRLGPSGTWANLDLRVGALGPYIPDGDPQAGAPAGYEIEMGVGWPQCAEALELSAMAHECSMARNPVAWFDLDTGEQLGCDDWASSEAGRPVVTPRGLIMPAFLDAQRNGYPTFNAGSCPYQAALEGYSSEDSEHVRRADDDGWFLAFSANDMMAMDDLAMLYEHHKAMILNDRPDALPSLNTQRNAGWTKGLDGKPLTNVSPSGSVSWKDYQSLTRDTVTIQAHPKHGTARGLRQWGWTLDLGVSQSAKAFCTKMVGVYLIGVDSCGVFFREFHTPYMPPGVQGAQMFHEMIDKAAVLRACRMIGDPALTGRVLDTIRLWIEKVLLNPNCRDAKWVHRQRQDGSEVDPIGPLDHGPERMAEHILCVLGLAALCEIDRGNNADAEYFLEAGLTVDVPHGNLQQRYAWLQAKTTDLQQYASYQAAIEALV